MGIVIRSDPHGEPMSKQVEIGFVPFSVRAPHPAESDGLFKNFVALFGQVADGDGNNPGPLGSSGRQTADDGSPQLAQLSFPSGTNAMSCAVRKSEKLRQPWPADSTKDDRDDGQRLMECSYFAPQQQKERRFTTPSLVLWGHEQHAQRHLHPAGCHLFVVRRGRQRRTGIEARIAGDFAAGGFHRAYPPSGSR